MPDSHLHEADVLQTNRDLYCPLLGDHFYADFIDDFPLAVALQVGKNEFPDLLA